MRPILSRAQIRFYLEKGYLLASGLIPEAVSRRACAAMWRNLGLDPDSRSTWEGVRRDPRIFDDTDLLPCYTPEMMAAVTQLGEGPPEPAAYAPPKRTYCINVFPSRGKWAPRHRHLDHTIKEHGHRTFPTPGRLASLIFLNDVAQHGGGTLVWPGSHLRAQALARSDPEAYALMCQLEEAFEEVDIGNPVELTPKQGDVLFYNVFTAHSGSMNVSETPRFAMAAKW